ncbi:hypothetical protein [Parafrankia sp. BMG5.11]|uniref:hypothetical protein n=1 Tax=Parafrankia sp. BMG5.11 TaxID=222540 RepID=UPI001A9CD374|nr:hypothetical protein [Parafrankia sp. BMG5.11]
MGYTGVISAVGDANGVGVPDLPRRFRRALLASFLVLLAVATCTVVLPVRPGGIIIRIANTTACAVTAVCCIWTGWRARGAARYPTSDATDRHVTIEPRVNSCGL